MTLDEAIEHAREVARTCNDHQCAVDHLQLAEWLSLLKAYTDTHIAEEAQRARHEMHGWQHEWKRETERRKELEAENAKLRKLVDGLRYCAYEAHGMCARVPVGGERPFTCCPLYDFDGREYGCEKLMRELRVEVEE